MRTRSWFQAILLALGGSALSSCGGGEAAPSGQADDATTLPRLDTSGSCAGICDAAVPSFPLLTDTTSYGDVTTYGGVDTSLASSGGACNYGVTGIRRYAAIQVNRLPGDGAGQWNGGRICGQGVHVRARTLTGWKETWVRIVDKCPDPHCGIDLGGAPAADLMGSAPGRYSGEWDLVSCKGRPELFDGPPRLWIKEGSGVSWAVVQVRDPWTAVAALLWRPAGSYDGIWHSMPWATEAENFFKVPSSVALMTDSVEIVVAYADSSRQRVRIPGASLALPGTSYPLE